MLSLMNILWNTDIIFCSWHQPWIFIIFVKQLDRIFNFFWQTLATSRLRKCHNPLLLLPSQLTCFTNHEVWHIEILISPQPIRIHCNNLYFWLVFNELSFSFCCINNISLSKSSALLCMSFAITISFVSSWKVSDNLKMPFTISVCFSKLRSSLSQADIMFVVLATAWVFKGDIPMIPKLSFNISLCSTIFKDVSNSPTSPSSHSFISTSSSARSLVFWWQFWYSFHPGITPIPLCLNCSAISTVALCVSSGFFFCLWLL